MIPFYPNADTPENCGISDQDIAQAMAFIVTKSKSGYMQDVEMIETICSNPSPKGQLMLRIACFMLVNAAYSATVQAGKILKSHMDLPSQTQNLSDDDIAEAISKDKLSGFALEGKTADIITRLRNIASSLEAKAKKEDNNEQE